MNTSGFIDEHIRQLDTLGLSRRAWNLANWMRREIFVVAMTVWTGFDREVDKLKMFEGSAGLWLGLGAWTSYSGCLCCERRVCQKSSGNLLVARRMQETPIENGVTSEKLSQMQTRPRLRHVEFYALALQPASVQSLLGPFRPVYPQALRECPSCCEALVLRGQAGRGSCSHFTSLKVSFNEVYKLQRCANSATFPKLLRPSWRCGKPAQHWQISTRPKRRFCWQGVLEEVHLVWRSLKAIYLQGFKGYIGHSLHDHTIWMFFSESFFQCCWKQFCQTSKGHLEAGHDASFLPCAHVAFAMVQLNLERVQRS